MTDTGIVDNLIVGSGLAAIATGMALHRREASFQVLDVGYDLDADTEDTIAHMARLDPPAWDRQARSRLFPPPPSSPSGLEGRLLFGSTFPYRVPDELALKFNGCKAALTHSIGGFANIWGAAMLPYSERSLRTWPLGTAELGPSYRNVLDYVPLSAESDDLREKFPLYTERATALERSEQVDGLLQALDHRKTSLTSSGISYGRARTAVNSINGNPSACRYCGHCLDGCVYGSIFTPRLHWKDIDADQRRLHKGVYVLEFKEHDDEVLVTGVSTQDGSLRKWRTKRLFLAAGHFATTRIIARSLGRINEPIRILDSQYFFFPFLSYQGFPQPPKFTLAEVFLEVLNEELSKHFVHLQVYGMN
ncbi:MAG: hypothetical protein JW993_00330, partial [Sedimentisphaerales bacterium]|nr:hypothetical protein [Sedimentisphaerales bacterium]